MIEPKQSDIGRKVIHLVHSNAEAEEGVITRFNEKYVFVRFGKEEKSAVTTRDELEWAGRPAAAWSRLRLPMIDGGRGRTTGDNGPSSAVTASGVS